MKKIFLFLSTGLVLNYALMMAKAALVLTGSSYVQNFNGISGSLPADWSVNTGATASSLGTAGATFNGIPGSSTTWSSTGGAFKNVASVGSGLSSGASAASQTAATDRALGIRQAGAFGDPGAAFVLAIANTAGLNQFSLSVDLQMLSVQSRSTIWSVQYAIGSSPSSFTTLGVYSDPGNFGSTTFTANSTDLGGINNQAQAVWFRVVALIASTGSDSRDTFGIDNFSLSYTAMAPVPEPSTFIAGALLLLPFGARGVRCLRNRKLS